MGLGEGCRVVTNAVKGMKFTRFKVCVLHSLKFQMTHLTWLFKLAILVLVCAVVVVAVQCLWLSGLAGSELTGCAVLLAR